MKRPRVLLVDGDAAFCDKMAEYTANAGYKMITVCKPEACYDLIEKETIDMLFLNPLMPTINDGLSFLNRLHNCFPRLYIVVLTLNTDSQHIVQSIMLGAKDFVDKQSSYDWYLTKIKLIEEQIELEEQNTILSVKNIGMVGNSYVMKRTYDEIIKASRFNVPVLITGETGVGKELAARAIHNLGRTCSQPFIAVNCGAIPETLIESELFGHEKGSYTNAVSATKGYFQSAEGGTIFLNEICELPVWAQSKLLRVLSEGEIHKIGSDQNLKVNFRVVSDSNQNFSDLIKKNLFREDLFYRISTVVIQIPPLRNRIEDIPDLTNHFIINFCNVHSLPIKQLSFQALQWLMQQNWPGNVRELKHTIERAVVNTTNHVIGVSELHSSHRDAGNQEKVSCLVYRDEVNRFEKDLITSTLIAHNWNINRTAKFLSIDKSNLIRRMRCLKISRP